MPASPASFLIESLRMRLRTNRGMRRGAHWVAWGSLACVLVVLGVRLSGLHDLPLAAWQVTLTGTILFFGNLLLSRPPPPADAARELDRHLGAKDTFLTSTDTAALQRGAYADRVRAQAEDQAAGVRAGKVLPLRWQRPTAASLGALTLAALCAAFVPLRDPFGLQKESRELRALRTQLVNAAKTARTEREHARAERDRQEGLARAALEDLVKAFRELDPLEQRRNAETLREQKAELASAWEKLQQQLANPGERRNPQQLGFKSELRERVEREWKEGRTDTLQAALQKARDLAEQVEKAGGNEKASLQKALQEQLKELADAAAQPGMARMAQQLQQALSQANASAIPQLTEEAIQALQESLRTAQLDAETLEQVMQQIQQLEQAMQAAQAAEQCNQKQCLGGKPGEGGGSEAGKGTGEVPRTIEEYAAHYQRLLQEQAGAGPGQGMKGPGTGEGGEAPEKPDEVMASQASNVKTDFRPKDILATWKVEGDAPEGSVENQYRYVIPRNPQEVSEAIVKEQIPPGYHESIQDYFSQPGPEE